MPISDVPKNFRDGTLLIEDGTGSPIQLTVTFEPGDFSVAGLSQGLYDVTMPLDRGEPTKWRKTNRKPIQLSFSAILTDLADATNKTLLNAVTKTGAFASGVSNDGANADVWTLDILWTIEGTNYGDASDHTIQFNNCHATIDLSEGDPNTYKVTLQTYEVPTYV